MANDPKAPALEIREQTAPKRKHIATGQKPPGGPRPGAGRPPGARNALPAGAVAAIVARRAALGRLGPNPATEDLVAVEHVTERLAAVLDCKVHHAHANAVIKAATVLLDATTGPQQQKVEHTGNVSIGVVDPYAAPPEGEGDDAA